MIQEWRDEAACKGSEVDFVPERGDYRSQNLAKKICATCVVQAECFDYAMQYPIIDGIWAGLAERGRRLIREGKRPVPEFARVEAVEAS